MPKPFDFSDTSDLPDELQKKLRRVVVRREMYLRLMHEAGRPVSATELRAAIYRQTGVLVSVSNMASMLTKMKKAGGIRQASYGKWEPSDG